MSRKSIATRWFINSFGAVAAILMIVVFSLYFVMKSYYYSGVEQYLTSEASIVVGILTGFYSDSDTDYSAEVQSAVEQFGKKDLMELMAIDNDGNVAITSSGFSAAHYDEMPDYDAALKSGDGVGQYTGYLTRASENEKYMAVSVVIDSENSAYSAIRVAASLSRVDAQILTFAAGCGFGSIFLLLLLALLGLYFVKSIVSPIRQIADSAKSLAKGDFSIRLHPKNDDEIGELCKVFNYMAVELENSETIKNEFISSVSHELRTPLTAIKGWSETILEMPDEETLRKGMKVISAETERLSSMVEELLDFSRIQNNSLLLQKTNMDILAELADALLIYAERAKRENIAIHYNEPDAVVMIYGDKNRIRQVFINIIDNAIKYGGENAVITVETVISDSSVSISVRDNGVGISAADLPKVKARFYKANNTVRGSGIGLAVADEIVSMHGGTLELESELGKGTTVIIKIPTIQKKNSGEQ